MIKPTIGRKVWFFSRGDQRLISYDETKPFDVNIVWVWSDTCVNVAGFDHNGTPFARTSVPINAEGVVGPHCEWMPYQQGQATHQAAQAAEAPKQ